ncbi:MAG TPA: F0F1 ATP synthase subunit B [Pirellulales bacterium]|jgi:F-type H+-transporting ATPase subunit b|nr:F0F1 ATP synthase subunit B [Pirellulales bacterium]
MSFLRRLAVVGLVGMLLAAHPLWAAAAAADHSAAAGDGHAQPADTPDPLEVDVDLAICTLIVFVLLLLVLKKFAWGPIAASLDLRERTIADHIALAEQTHEEGKKLLAMYEAKLAAAQDEVRAILDQARRQAEQAHQELLAKARGEAQAETQRAKREIETAKDQAIIEVAEKSADQAVALAGKILGAKIDAADHKSLIESALASFQSAHLRN